MNLKSAIIFTLGLTASLACFGADKASKANKNNSGEIVLKGSDIIKTSIEDVLNSVAKRDKINLKIDMRGTYPILKSGTAERFDIAIVALPKGHQLPADLIAMPFAYQIATVVVNISNPIDEISTDNLRRIYSNFNRIETWDQIGVRYAGLRSILPLITNYSDGVYVELFKHSAFDGDSLGDWVSMMKNTQEVLANIRVNNSAIGVVGRVYDKNMVKLLSVSDSKSSGNYKYSFPPTQIAVFNGDYPLTLSYYIVFKKENAKKIKKVAAILLGKELADKLDTSGFYSAPRESRKKSIFELDLL